MELLPAPESPNPMKPSLDPGSATPAFEAMQALSQAWRQGADAAPALISWANKEGPGILWRWGWHFPFDAQRMAIEGASMDGKQRRQADACAGFAVFGAWEGQAINPPLDFDMWTEWEGDSLRAMANIQWEVSVNSRKQNFLPALTGAAKEAFITLANGVSDREEWGESNEEMRDDCQAREFFLEHFADAPPLALTDGRFDPAIASLLARAVERFELHQAAPQPAARINACARL